MGKFYCKYFPAEPDTFGARYSILALVCRFNICSNKFKVNKSFHSTKKIC